MGSTISIVRETSHVGVAVKVRVAVDGGVGVTLGVDVVMAVLVEVGLSVGHGVSLGTGEGIEVEEGGGVGGDVPVDTHATLLYPMVSSRKSWASTR